MFYRKVIGVRSDLGLTQEEMAKLLNISVRTYRNKERGLLPFNQIEMIIIMKKANLTFEEAGLIFFAEEANKELYQTFIVQNK